MNKAAPNQDMTEGIIWKQILIFFFPVLLGSFFQQLYSMTDAVILGRFAGKEALAAIDSTGSLIRLFINLFVGISSGATIIISQQYGAKESGSVSATVHTAIAFAALGGLSITVIGLACTSFGMRIMGIPADILAAATTYVRIYFSGMIASMVYNMGAGILRAVGDSRRPLIFLIISSFVNIALDLLFVAVFCWGVTGAGVATVISQFVSALLVLLSLLRADDAIRLVPRRIRLESTVVKQIFKTGLPIGLQTSMYPISNMLIQSSINRLGTTTIAAWAICGKIDTPVFLIMDALTISVSTFVAQNYGAKKLDRIRKSVRVCIAIALSLLIPITIVLYLWGGTLSRLFIEDAEVSTLTVSMLRFYSPFIFTFAWEEVLAGAIRGSGETFGPMLITMLGACVLRIIWIVFIVPLNPTVLMIIACYPLSWSITSLLFILYYRHYKRRRLMAPASLTA